MVGRHHGLTFRLRGYVRARHVDFVLVDADWQPLLAVEVDGASHADPRARETDALKDRILTAAGIPLVRLRPERASWPRQLAAVPGRAMLAGARGQGAHP